MIEVERNKDLSVQIKAGTKIWTINSDEFAETIGGRYVFFSGLDASQMSVPVYLTVYEGSTAVSDTICYSVESYAYAKQNSGDVKLVNVIDAMMKYGNSAKAYITTKVYFHDKYHWGNIYAYTYVEGASNEGLGAWPGTLCKYEGNDVWSVDMPDSCTHILFSGSGYNYQQTIDIVNPGESLIAVSTSKYGDDGFGHYGELYEWVEYIPGKQY